MSAIPTPPLTVEAFGAQLLKSGDLDPTYIAINEAKLDQKTLHRLCLAYWCYYHLGAAAKMAEAKSDKAYWSLMMQAAVYSPVSELNKPGHQPWPRGAERRHYRGAQAVSSMASLQSRYNTPTDAVRGMTTNGQLEKVTFTQIMNRVKTHRGFGSWIGFKIADMTERVLRFPVDFADCELQFYDEPRKGAALVFFESEPAARWPVAGGEIPYADTPWDYPIRDEDFKTTVARLIKHFRNHKALGLTHRKPDLFETETVLCKYKSYRRGHYPIGKDTKEVLHSLEGWGDLAKQLKTGLLNAGVQVRV